MPVPAPFLFRLRLVLLLTLAWSAACGHAQPAARPAPPPAVDPRAGGPPPPPAEPAPPPEPVPGAAVPVTRADPQWGEPLAPVTVVVWSDFECPFCARLTSTLEQLKAAYGPDNLRIVWKHFPLPFHENARPAAIAAEAVFQLRGPDSFWKFHRLAYENQRALTPENLESWAAEAGVAPPDLRAALALPRHEAKVDEDVAQGKLAGVTGTPASLINGVFLSGAQSIDKFRAVIDEQRQHAEELRKEGVAPERIYAQLSDKNAANRPPPPSGSRPQEDDKTVWRVPIDRSPVRGKPTALVTMVMIGDFQCPFCAKVVPTVEALEKKYGDKLRLVFKHNPLPFHLRAEPAAELAIEARAQRGDAMFWKAFQLLFADPAHLEDADLEARARSLGIDAARAMKAIAAHKHAAVIARDQELADDIEAPGTPQFFINGRRLRGAQPSERFEAVIDEELERAEKLVAGGTPRAKLYEALQRGAKSGTPAERILAPSPTRDNPGKGAKVGAKVVVQIFADFQCPFCKRVAPTLDELIAAYPGKVRVVFRHKPLPVHKQAGLAAEAAVEAFRQKGDAGFWAMAERLWEDQSDTGLSRPEIERKAAEIGLDVPRLKGALDAGTHRAAVAADSAIADQLKITGTPSFAINDYYLGGAQPLSKLKRLVAKALGPREPPTPESLHGASKAPSQPSAAAGAVFGAKHIVIMFAGSRRAPPHVTRTRDEARALAEAVLQKARAGADFAGLAAQYSDEPSGATRGGDLGTFPRGAMVPEFQQGLESTRVGELSEVVATPFGFHLILRTR
jgi:protein-disulfide isomerase